MAPSFRDLAQQHLGAVADDQLGAAAADVDDEDPLVEQRQELDHAEMDQTRLLDARHDVDVDADLVMGAP